MRAVSRPCWRVTASGPRWPPGRRGSSPARWPAWDSWTAAGGGWGGRPGWTRGGSRGDSSGARRPLRRRGAQCHALPAGRGERRASRAPRRGRRGRRMTFSADAFGTLDVPGGTLYWESTGRGPALVLAHAGIADHGMWDDDVPSFAGGPRVVTYHCRGFGRSRTDAVDYSNRADLAALLDHLGIERAALLGCSRGGQIALDFTLERPERVSALVLVACGPGGMGHQTTPVERALLESEEPLS